MATYTALAPLFTDIANAIRSKTGETGTITANSFPSWVANLGRGSGSAGSYDNLNSLFTDIATELRDRLSITDKIIASDFPEKILQISLGTPLNDLSIGTLVYMNYGSYGRTAFRIIHKGKPSSEYDDSCNGVWLQINTAIKVGAYSSSGRNNFVTSDYKTICDNAINNLDTNIQSKVKTVKIPYLNGNGNNYTYLYGSDGLEMKFFPLSMVEFGTDSSISSSLIPADGYSCDYYSGIGDKKSEKRLWEDEYGDTITGTILTRGPRIDNNYTVLAIDHNDAWGWCNSYDKSLIYSVHTCIMPFDVTVDDNYDIMA